ncbi:dsRNA-specific ribonuclease [Streptomyces mobaraensis NBRC 13819 = DSM 40847]|uniref:DsRNA-specific ribonuclease n=1 Tax=Streptomyces mobaraensis (strain ATCC 29032 / DSM 40847 / JCM 4168 / NBRC 13819 / NCIMB 11159 / IPCR 16-22) TaxID=1223523 RepID=M3B7X1_STRM1|nr:dsRNA-specific ribonuclease [Streptomyces mobaraensis NBRC 13819 = DSM 40847]
MTGGASTPACASGRPEPGAEASDAETERPARPGLPGRGAQFVHPRLDRVRCPRERSRHQAGAVRGDDEVVLDADADAAQGGRQGLVVGLEVEAGFDGEDLTLLQDAVEVGVGARLGAVVDVQAEHVAAAAEGVAAVEVAVGGAEDAPVGEALGDDAHAGPVEVAEARARFEGGDARVLGGEDEFVDLPLDGREAAGEGEGAGDVGGVEGVRLHAGVEEEQVARVQPAVVAGPVQDAGVRAGRGDGLVAGAVALGAGAQPEDAFDPALAARVRQGARKGADDVLEAGGGVVHGLLQLADLPGVLDEPQLAEHGGEFAVAGGVAAGREGGVGLQGRAVDARRAFGLGGVRRAADPELAVPAVAVERRGAGGAGRARPDVQHRLMAVRAVGLQDEDVAGLVLARQAGQPGVGAVRAEAEVAVVGADLRRTGGHDQPLAREARGEAGPAGGGGVREGRPGAPGRRRYGRPARSHEGRQFVGHRQVVAHRADGDGGGSGHGLPPGTSRRLYHFTLRCYRSHVMSRDTEEAAPPPR